MEFAPSHLRTAARAHPPGPGRRSLAGVARLGGLPLLVMLAGCPPPPAAPPVSLTLAEVVQRINANNVPLDFGLKGQLAYADVVYTERVPEPGRSGRKPGFKEYRHRFQLDGTVLLLKPSHLFALLRHGLAGDTVMELGVNGDEYWLGIKPDMNKLWWGKCEHLDKPCNRSVPIRPDHVIEALGASDLPVDTTGPRGPAPRVTENRNELLFFRTTDEGQVYIEKEYRVDRWAPFLVREVVHRNRDGQVLMRTQLGDYRPVVASQAKAALPKMAHDIRVEWPFEKATLHLVVDRWIRLDALHVEAEAFVMPLHDPNAGFSEVEQVDRECEP